MTVNKQILVGNLVADPELRTTSSGMAICKLRIATNSRRKVGGEWTEATEYHNVTAFGKQGENIAQYLTKGRTIYVEGETRHRQYEDGNGDTKWFTEVIADTTRFLGGAKAGRQSSGRSGAKAETPQDDVPF